MLPSSERGRRWRLSGPGIWARRLVRLAHRPPEAPPDDLTLLDRVEDVIFTDRSLPKERLSIEVEDGVVALRGQLTSDGEIARVRRTVEHVRGVREVRSRLRRRTTRRAMR